METQEVKTIVFLGKNGRGTPTRSSTVFTKGNIPFTVKILCIGTDRSQQIVQTKIRLLLKKQYQGLRCLPFHQHLLDALMQCYINFFLFLGQLWQLFEVSQILEFLWYTFLQEQPH